MVYFLICFCSSLFEALAPFWAPFRGFGAILGAKRWPREANGNQKAPKMEPWGCQWEALNIWYLLYGRHMGRSRGRSGSEVFGDCAPEGVPERSKIYCFAILTSRGQLSEILGDFGCPLGCQRACLWASKFAHFFRPQRRAT